MDETLSSQQRSGGRWSGWPRPAAASSASGNDQEVFRILDGGGDGFIDMNEFVSGMIGVLNTDESFVVGDRTHEVLRRKYEEARDAARAAPGNKVLWHKYESAVRLLMAAQCGEGGPHQAGQDWCPSDPRRDESQSDMPEEEFEGVWDDCGGVLLEFSHRRNERYMFLLCLACWLGIWGIFWWYYKSGLSKCRSCPREKHPELVDPKLRVSLGTQDWVCIFILPCFLVWFLCMRWYKDTMRLRLGTVVRTVCFIVIAICALEHCTHISHRFITVEVWEL